MLNKQSLDFITDFFSGDDYQLPSHHHRLDILLTPKQAENNWLIPKTSKMAKTEISINNNWRKRAKVMIVRNDKTGTPLAAKSGVNRAEIERCTKRERQIKSELNYGTVAALVEPE